MLTNNVYQEERIPTQFERFLAKLPRQRTSHVWLVVLGVYRPYYHFCAPTCTI